MQWSETNGKVAIFLVRDCGGTNNYVFQNLVICFKIELQSWIFWKIDKSDSMDFWKWVFKIFNLLFCFLTAVVWTMQTHKLLYLLLALDWFCAVIALDIEALTFCFFKTKAIKQCSEMDFLASIYQIFW